MSRFLIAKNNDTEYLAAVEAGDINKCQALVEQAAKAAGYMIKAYHGTQSNFKQFDESKIGQGTGNFGHYGKGFYFSDDKLEAITYTGNKRESGIMECYLKIQKPFSTEKSEDLEKYAKDFGYQKENVAIDKNWLLKELQKKDKTAYTLAELILQNGYEKGWEILIQQNDDEVPDSSLDLNEVSDWVSWTDNKSNTEIPQYILDKITEVFSENPLTIKGYTTGNEPRLLHMTDYGRSSSAITNMIKADGFDGIIAGSEIIVFSPSQIKSADPITYDNSGTVIPLSKRFDSSKLDIRSSIMVVSKLLKAKAVSVQATVKKEGSEYFVYSEKGKKLSKGYKTKDEADKRLKEIEYWKHAKGESQIDKGIKVEKEHSKTYHWLKQVRDETGEWPTAEEFYKHIAENHTDEFKNYYDALDIMEAELKKEKKVEAAREMCWSIKEHRPIPVTVKERNNGGFHITVAPMLMKYETHNHLDQAHLHQEIAVSYFSYDYENGQCDFFADSREDVDKWLERYKDIVVEANVKDNKVTAEGTGNLSKIPNVYTDGDFMRWKDDATRIELELNPPGIFANPSNKYEGGIRYKGWAADSARFSTKEQAMAWLDKYDLSRFYADSEARREPTLTAAKQAGVQARARIQAIKVKAVSDSTKDIMNILIEKYGWKKSNENSLRKNVGGNPKGGELNPEGDRIITMTFGNHGSMRIDLGFETIGGFPEMMADADVVAETFNKEAMSAIARHDKKKNAMKTKAWKEDQSDITPLAGDVMDAYLDLGFKSRPDDSEKPRIKKALMKFKGKLSDADKDVLEDYNYHMALEVINELDGKIQAMKVNASTEGYVIGDVYEHPRFGKVKLLKINDKTYSIPMADLEILEGDLKGEKIYRALNELRPNNKIDAIKKATINGWEIHESKDAPAAERFDVREPKVTRTFKKFSSYEDAKKWCEKNKTEAMKRTAGAETDSYDAGYDDGFYDGEMTKSEGNPNEFTKDLTTLYGKGYADGFNDGYNEGKSSLPGKESKIDAKKVEAKRVIIEGDFDMEIEGVTYNFEYEAILNLNEDEREAKDTVEITLPDGMPQSIYDEHWEDIEAAAIKDAWDRQWNEFADKNKVKASSETKSDFQQLPMFDCDVPARRVTTRLFKRTAAPEFNIGDKVKVVDIDGDEQEATIVEKKKKEEEGLFDDVMSRGDTEYVVETTDGEKLNIYSEKSMEKITALKNLDKVKNSIGADLYNHISDLNEHQLRKMKKDLESELARMKDPKAGYKPDNKRDSSLQDELWFIKYRLGDDKVEALRQVYTPGDGEFIISSANKGQKFKVRIAPEAKVLAETDSYVEAQDWIRKNASDEARSKKMEVWYQNNDGIFSLIADFEWNARVYTASKKDKINAMNKEKAIEVLKKHSRSTLSKLYDTNEEVAEAVKALIPNFEYPDYSHMTIGEIIKKAGAKVNAVSELESVPELDLDELNNLNFDAEPEEAEAEAEPKPGDYIILEEAGKTLVTKYQEGLVGRAKSDEDAEAIIRNDAGAHYRPTVWYLSNLGAYVKFEDFNWGEPNEDDSYDLAATAEDLYHDGKDSLVDYANEQGFYTFDPEQTHEFWLQQAESNADKVRELINEAD